MILRIQKPNIYNFIFIVLILDLVLGGSGRIISVGPLSLRYILFLIVGLVEILIFLNRGILLNKSLKATSLFLCYLTISAILSFSINPSGNVIDEFLGYLPLLLSPFFGFCFAKHKIRVEHVKRLFMIASCMLGLFSILIWTYAFLRGISAYQTVEVNFLRHYDIGRLAFSGRLVRLFMKGTVFCAISFVMAFYDWISGQRNKLSFVIMVIDFVAVILSFTLGLYIAVAVGIALVLMLLNKNEKYARSIALFSLSFIAIIFVTLRFGIIDLMAERFSGEYTLSYKVLQTRELFKDLIHNPIVGNGVGHELAIDYGFRMISGYRAENMWGEILNHYGFFGTALFLAVIVSTFKSLWNKTKISGNVVYALFAIGIIVLSVLSISNPFLNNAIGLTFLAICIGMTQDDSYMLRL